MKPKPNKRYKGMGCRVHLVREGNGRKKIILNKSSDVFKLVREELCSSDRERFLSLLLTAKNNLIGVETVSIGTINGCIVSPREVFKSALLANADSIIICHNHPSGDPTPSRYDIKLTNTLVKAGDLIGIDVKDHVVVAQDGYRSLMHNQLKGG
jgi:DNA repair protein RadC